MYIALILATVTLWVIGVNLGRSRFSCYRYRKTLVLYAGLTTGMVLLNLIVIPSFHG